MFVEILLQEIDIQKDYLQREVVSTIYFGGGTPSLLQPTTVQRIIEKINAHFVVHQDVEITLEANPDDLNDIYLKELKNTSINRLSIGIQSFYDDDLHYLNRIHTAENAIAAIKKVQDSGFTNLTIDLIYGIPTLTDEKWQSNISRFLGMNIPHLSAYALTVEPKTALNTLIDKGKMKPVDDQQTAEQFNMLLQQMEMNDFVHYEISNFALHGHYSRHNSIYWSGGNYLGLGPSAHSYNGHTRQWNVSSLTKYLQIKESSEVIAEREFLTLEQRYNEYVMTSLRTAWGCDMEHIRNSFGNKFAEHCNERSGKFQTAGQLIMKQSRLFLTNKGKLFADGIASDLFI